jgi:hypothetical protein
MIKDEDRTKDLTDAIQKVRDDPNLTPANQQRLNLDQLAIVIAKLGTDHNPVEYAGVKHDQMFFSGSLLKVALLYASYELRARLNALAPTVAWDWNPFFSAVRSAVPLIANGQEREMNIDEILRITATTDAGVLSFDFTNDHLKDLKTIVSDQNSNVAPKKVMHRLGYSYVNGALAAAGFFDGRTGIWLANDFPPNQWRQFHVPVATGGKSSEAMTAVDMANLLTCMHRGTLVDETSSKEMMDIMRVGGSWASKLTPADRASLSFTTKGAKVGHDPSADARVDKVKSEAVFLDRGGVPFIAVWQNFPDGGPSVAANLLRIYKIIDEVLKKWP